MKFFSSKEAKLKVIIAGIIVLFIIVSSVVFIAPLFKSFNSPSEIKNIVLGFGVLAPLAFIGLQVLQMVFLFIPASPIIITGGYLFGSLGILYSLLGIMLGSIIVFYIGRLFGRPFLESVVDKKVIDKIDYQSDSVARTLFVLFLIPILPHDAFSYMAGITKIKLKHYAFVVFIGKLPQIIVLTLVGYQLTKLNLFWSLLLIGIIIIGSIIIFKYKSNIERNLHGYIKKFKKK